MMLVQPYVITSLPLLEMPPQWLGLLSQFCIVLVIWITTKVNVFTIFLRPARLLVSSFSWGTPELQQDPSSSWSIDKAINLLTLVSSCQQHAGTYYKERVLWNNQMRFCSNCLNKWPSHLIMFFFFSLRMRFSKTTSFSWPHDSQLMENTHLRGKPVGFLVRDPVGYKGRAMTPQALFLWLEFLRNTGPVCSVLYI